VGKPYEPAYVIARGRQLIEARQNGHGAGALLVLVIDDSVTFREELRQALEGAGYRVATAASGEEGLRTAVGLRRARSSSTT